MGFFDSFILSLKGLCWFLKFFIKYGALKNRLRYYHSPWGLSWERLSFFKGALFEPFEEIPFFLPAFSFFIFFSFASCSPFIYFTRSFMELLNSVMKVFRLYLTLITSLTRLLELWSVCWRISREYDAGSEGGSTWELYCSSKICSVSCSK